MEILDNIGPYGQYYTLLDNMKEYLTILGYVMEYQAILGCIFQYFDVLNNLTSPCNC